MNERLEARWPMVLAILSVTAAVARLSVAFAVWSLPHSYLLNADAGEYNGAALFLSGLGEGSLPPVFQLSPGTMLWGAAWHRVFGPSVWAVLLPQIVLGCLTVALSSSAARRLWGPVAGLVTGALLVACKPLILYETAILPTGPTVFLCTLFVWFAVRFRGEFTPGRAAVLGLIIGLATVFRPNAILVLPAGIALVFGAGQSRSKVISAMVMTMGCAIVVLPITAMNLARGGVFVPITSGMGMNLFIGNHQGSTGRLNPVFQSHHASESFEKFTGIAESTTGRPMDPAETSAFWTRRTAEEIIDDPVGFVSLIGRKAVYGLNDFESPDNLNTAFLEEVVPLLRAPLPGFGLLFSLGLLGLILAWRNQPPGTRAIHGVFAVGILTMLIFFVSGRYRAISLPMLAIGAGLSTSWTIDKIRLLRDRETPDRRGPAIRLALASLALALTATVTSLPLLHPKFEPELARLSNAYEKKGDLDRAAACSAKLAEMAAMSGDEQLARWARGRTRELEEKGTGK